MIRFPFVVLAASIALSVPSYPEQVLESGGFEWPPVTKRKTRAEGGDLTKSAMNADWLMFRDKSDAEGGKLILGLTNEISRSGRQSMFVHFDKVTKQGATSVIASDLLPILPNETYRVGIWGRVDKKEPVALDTRIPYLRLRVDFFKNTIDEETQEPTVEQTGEPEFRTQTLPGSRTRRPLFTTTQWNQFWANMKSPEDAAFLKLTWTFETPRTEGETNGIMYFDDMTIEGAPAAKIDPFADDPEVQAERKATANDPNLVQPDQEKPAMNVTPLTTPATPPPAEPEKKDDKAAADKSAPTPVKSATPPITPKR